MRDLLLTMYGSKQTVFTTREIALLAGEKDLDTLKSKLAYYVKRKKIIRLRRGIFAKNADYDRNELAVRIYSPAYISLETVLGREGVTFQYYDSIFVASYLSREIIVAGNKIVYRKFKNEVLINQKGLINCGYYFEASKERAFLDRLYLSGTYSFDNLRGMDWDTCQDLLSVYKSKRLEETLTEYRKKYAE
jgi:hypothetical protein